MYADDTILLASTKEKLQHLLQGYESYCNKWELNINTNKTKVMIFGKHYRKPKFTLINSELEIVNDFIYLGVKFSKNGRFIKAMKRNVDKARKAFYLLLRRCKENMLPIDCQIELFTKCIEPILLYGCEVWGYEDSSVIEKFRLHCLKIILHAKNCTPNYMLYGELGLRPLESEIKKRMISFWMKLINNGEGKLSQLMYDLLLFEYNSGIPSQWLKFVNEILEDTGNTYMWKEQRNITKLNINQVKQVIEDQSIQKISDICSRSNKGRNYLVLKEKWKMEPYFYLLGQNAVHNIFRYRSANHRLPVETGRFVNIEYRERICQECKNDIGDEYHYLLSCPKFASERKKYLDKKHYKRPSMEIYRNIMCTEDQILLKNTSLLVNIIIKSIKT